MVAMDHEQCFFLIMHCILLAAVCCIPCVGGAQMALKLVSNMLILELYSCYPERATHVKFGLMNKLAAYAPEFSHL